MTTQPTLLAIAGSDPSGGAGIQADLKTMTAIGVYGAAAITCLTVQNSLGVQDIMPLAAKFVRAQVQAVLDDHAVSHIKIGMLGTLEIAEEVSAMLSLFHGTVVYDPVLAATTGQALMGSDAKEHLKRALLPEISYLTPNIAELEQLSGGRIETAGDGIRCAESLLASYPRMQGIVVKGGHLEQDKETIRDFLVLDNGKLYESKRKRLANRNLHGTGCTYSSALASFLCLGNGPQSAFLKTGEFMDRIIRAGMDRHLVQANVNGPLLHYSGADQ